MARVAVRRCVRAHEPAEAHPLLGAILEGLVAVEGPDAGVGLLAAQAAASGVLRERGGRHAEKAEQGVSGSPARRLTSLPHPHPPHRASCYRSTVSLTG